MQLLSENMKFLGAMYIDSIFNILQVSDEVVLEFQVLASLRLGYYSYNIFHTFWQEIQVQLLVM